ncbi:MAG TPA: hypothetical protein VI172_03965 [Candidatus Dormibacteraeota bacterium]
MTTHRFQPILDMDDDWFIVDAELHLKTARSFSRDHALLFCFELEREPSRAPDVSIWEEWR